jgi:hypothetical protein
MASITITVTAQESDFSTFADELGYLTEVLKTPEELALLEEPIALQDRIKPNPQTKTQFLEEYFKTITVNELYRKKAGVIDAQVNATKEAEKAALKVGITGAVGVTSQV